MQNALSPKGLAEVKFWRALVLGASALSPSALQYIGMGAIGALIVRIGFWRFSEYQGTIR